MGKKEIIEDLAKNKFVENVTKSYKMITPYIEDLCQDIYMWLCEKDEDKIVSLYEKGELDYFVRKMIKNNICSKTSPFYTKYEKFRKNSNNIDDFENEATQRQD